MKAVVEMGPSNLPEGVQSGRVARRRDVENEEIQMYLSKLKDLVPFMPKNKKLSKLEVIRHVIEYICELQYALETHTSVTLDPVEFVARLGADTVPTANVTTTGTRQPLGTLAPSPNTISTVRLNESSISTTQPESSSRPVSTYSKIDYKFRECDHKRIRRFVDPTAPYGDKSSVNVLSIGPSGVSSHDLEMRHLRF